MKISIFGLGYVGCVSLGCLAKNGHNVIGVDLNSKKVDFINSGKASIVEKEIDEIIHDGYKNKRITASTNSKASVINTDISIICVGTPSTKEGHLYLGAIYKVAEEIGEALKDKETFHVILIRSTVLPGTNKKVSSIIAEKSGKECNKDFAVISNPEFLREGTAVKDYYNPAFTLIGSENEKANDIVKEMYKSIKAPLITTEIELAEIIKYVNNSFHALKITFANEIGNICKTLGIDGHKLMQIFCMDDKLNISNYYLKPGFAYGGSCLPKDLKALKTIAHDQYLECPILENIEKSNEMQKRIVLERLIDFNKRKIGFLGISFKGGTDDLRNSPIVDIIEVLIGKGYEISIFDNNVHFSKIMGANRDYILNKIPLISEFIINDSDQFIEKCEVFVVVNNSKEYADILERLDISKTIFDLVNIGNDELKTNNYIGLSW